MSVGGTVSSSLFMDVLVSNQTGENYIFHRLGISNRP